MTPEQLDDLVARTGHERFRFLASDENPDVGGRERIRAFARGETDPPEPAYPSLLRQAAKLATSAVNHVAGGLRKVGQAEHDRRLAICDGCDQLDREQNRCRACGCYLAFKPWGAREACPLGKWEEAAEKAPDR